MKWGPVVVVALFAACATASSYNDSELRRMIADLDVRLTVAEQKADFADRWIHGWQDADLMRWITNDPRLRVFAGQIQCLQWQHPGIEECVPELGPQSNPTPAPEPADWLMLAIGALLLVALSGRKRCPR